MLWLLCLLVGCGGGDDRAPGFPDGDRLPVAHEFRSDGLLYFETESGYGLRVEFGGWGSHLDPHTGHAEGDPKVGWQGIVAPPGEMVEMVGLTPGAGNGDGVCDPGEICGVTAETVKANHVWAHNPYAELELVGLSVYQQSEGFIDEELHWVLETLLPGRLSGITLGHLGALSPELEALLEQRVGSDFFADPAAVGYLDFFEDPIALPEGMRLGRGQRISRGAVAVDGRMIYDARTGLEWFAQSDGDTAECMFLNYSEADRQNLQKALDSNLQSPVIGGGFDSDRDGEISIYAGAQGRICNSQHMDGTAYDTLSSENSRAWTNVDDPREVLAIVPIHSDTAGYQVIRDRLSARGGELLFRWASAQGGPIQQQLGLSFSLGDFQGEILDLEDATAPAGQLILSAQAGGPFPEGIESFAIGISYRMEADRLILRWGDAVTSLDAVSLPAPVDAGAACDGDRVRCYSRDWLGLNQG